MQISPSWEDNSFSGSQEIPSILQNPKIHYCAHNSPPLVPILSQIQSMPSNFKIHLCPGLPSSYFPYVFIAKPCMHFSSLFHTYHLERNITMDLKKIKWTAVICIYLSPVHGPVVVSRKNSGNVSHTPFICYQKRNCSHIFRPVYPITFVTINKCCVWRIFNGVNVYITQRDEPHQAQIP